MPSLRSITPNDPQIIPGASRIVHHQLQPQTPSFRAALTKHFGCQPQLTHGK
ncbi:hypothetical protein TRAPUB_9646 [Trametes pubescens]|uniref:Uncharacterized protein n=1 Tax=Trametes pubescens TaxID=154538 RepID=A0A1M2W1R2_TRAPU|nr:hypothetical protein TRAPUB_9646 [Trametes pubescens]